MKFLEKIKTRHTLKFAKSQLNMSGDSIWDLQWREIDDSRLIATLRECANKNNCRIMSIENFDFLWHGKVIIIYSTKFDFVEFCADFCEAMGNYITDVNF